MQRGIDAGQRDIAAKAVEGIRKVFENLDKIDPDRIFKILEDRQNKAK